MFSDLLFVAALSIVLFGLALVGDEIVVRHRCEVYAQTTGKETKKPILDTCYVHTAQGWQRWDEYKVRATASEGLGP